jgi:hypothetical protein
MQKIYALFLLLTGAVAWAQDDSIYWLGNFQEALKVAKQTGKPIFLEYRCEA